ncbi:MAG: hypothetical protein WBG37_12655 [Desulfobacterales bacterium]|jgi:hypothetical protein
MGEKVKKNESTRTVLDGVIIPSAWDEDDQVIAVSLAASDDHDYLIENGDKFIALIGMEIQADGVVTKTRRAQRSIRIKRYEVIEKSLV